MEVNGLTIYKFLDYIPVASIFTNTITLIAKGVLALRNCHTSSNPPLNQASFTAYIKEKSSCRCIALILLPLISNLFFIIWDYTHPNDTLTQEQPITELPKHEHFARLPTGDSAKLPTSEEIDRLLCSLFPTGQRISLDEPQWEERNFEGKQVIGVWISDSNYRYKGICFKNRQGEIPFCFALYQDKKGRWKFFEPIVDGLGMTSLNNFTFDQLSQYPLLLSEAAKRLKPFFPTVSV